MKCYRLSFQYYKIALAVLLVFCISGCWDAKELANLAIVAALGIDRADESGNLIITAQIVKPGEVKSTGGGEGGGGQTQQKGGLSPAVLIVQSSGKTVGEAVRNLAFQLNREVYLPYNNIIVVGRELAAHGVRPIMDFFIRTRDTRETAWIIIANNKAGDILGAQTGLEKIPAISITGLIQNRGVTSEVSGEMQQEFVNRLMSKSMSPYSFLIDAVGEQKKLRLIGTAVFKKDRLVGQLDKIETRGFLWITGKVNMGIITVNIAKGGQVDCGILTSESKVLPVLSPRPQIKVEVTCRCDVNNETLPEDFTKPETMNRMEKLLAKGIRGEMKKAILKAHQLDSDFFGFGEAIHRKYPKEWKALEPNWDRYFINMPIQLKVKAKLIELGLNTKPAMPQ